jgi:hypothetical protein
MIRSGRRQCHGVFGSALDLGRVFENEQAVRWGVRDDLGDDRIRERGLARSRAARHDDVETIPDGLPDDRGLQLRHHAGGHIVGQGNEP